MATGNSQLRSRYVMAGRVKTHYSESGQDGPVVVMCHGGAAGSSGEAGFGGVMAILADKFQCYAPDGVGGYGDTDAYYPASEGTQSRVDHLEAFMDTLCLDQVCMVGNSQGAWVAAKYALEHPDRVRKLFLVASGTIASAMGLKSIETEGAKALRAYDGSRESMRRMLEALVLDKSKITDAVVDLRNASANRPGAKEARQIFQKGQQRLTQDPNLKLKYEMNDNLTKLTIPTICIWGEQDNFAPVELGRQLEKLLPNIKFRYVQNAGHQVQTDQPQLVATMMTEFFTS